MRHVIHIVLYVWLGNTARVYHIHIPREKKKKIIFTLKVGDKLKKKYLPEIGALGNHLTKHLDLLFVPVGTACSSGWLALAMTLLFTAFTDHRFPRLFSSFHPLGFCMLFLPWFIRK